MTDLIGQYQIIKQIGCGGTATVYQAQPDRDVTIARSSPAAKATFPWPWLAGCGVLAAVVVLCLALFAIGWINRDRFVAVETPTPTPRLPTPTPSPTPDSGRIVFTSNRDDNSEIYLINADGSELTNLTNHPDNDYVPAWSPDGKHIAFRVGRGGKPEIYVVKADGSEQINLTNNPAAADWNPSWSPDGRHITFYSKRDDPDPENCGRDGKPKCNSEIYVVSADGSDLTRLTNNPASDRHPRWSP